MEEEMNRLQLPEKDHDDGRKEDEDKITGVVVALVFLGQIIHFPAILSLQNIEQEPDPLFFRLDGLEVSLEGMFGGQEVDHLLAQVHIGRFRHR